MSKSLPKNSQNGVKQSSKRAKENLAELTPILQKIASGDFTQKIEIPGEENEFAEFLAALSLIINKFQAATVELKKAKEDLETKIEERTSGLEAKIEEMEKANRLMVGRELKMVELREEAEKLKEKFRSERDKTNAILHGIGDCVFVIDTDYKIILFNKAAELISGFNNKKVIGKRYDQFLKFVFEKDGQPNDRFIKEAMMEKKMTSMKNHTSLIRRGGIRVPVADSAAPLLDIDEKVIGCVVVFRDVSREREVDRMKTEFLSIAAHQLRTPLGSMRWNMEMMLNGDLGRLGPEVKRALSQIYESNKRMIALINDLLNVSRIEEGRVRERIETVDVNELVDSVVKELKPQVKNKSLTMEVTKTKVPVKLKIDRRRLRGVIVNLLSNAIKYNRPEGWVKLELEKSEDFIQFQVKDNGIGIPEEDQAKVFDKFSRAANAIKSETEGSGLGLFVVKFYTEAWGGRVSFESQEGKGSTFVAEVPLEPKSHVLDRNLKARPHQIKENNNNDDRFKKT